VAAPDVTLSRAGVINNDAGTWAKDNALFLKVFSGEVITAFDRSCIFKGLAQERTIQNGKSAQFPVTGRFTGRFHTPGKMIEGQGNMAQNEVVIKIDDLLIADAALYDLDEAKNHYDIRSIYSKELGNALAREFDKRIARVLTLGARVAAGDLTANLPAGLSPDDPFRVGTRVDINKATPTPDDYVAAVFAAARALDEKDVPADGRVIVCSPEVYYTLIQSSRAVNFDFNQQGTNGSYSKGQIAQLAGFSIYSSNHIKQGNVTAKAGEQGFTYGGADTVLSSVDMSKTKMLAFQKGAVGVLKLRDLSMQMTGNDYNVMYQSTLMVAKYACGFGYLRPEAIVEIHNSL
jgi:hypothetical protein